MPRLDNSGRMGLTFFPKFSHPTNVDKRTPIDLCRNCWRDIWFESEEEHPPYEDGVDGKNPYHCVKCGSTLIAEDNDAPRPQSTGADNAD